MAETNSKQQTGEYVTKADFDALREEIRSDMQSSLNTMRDEMLRAIDLNVSHTTQAIKREMREEFGQQLAQKLSSEAARRQEAVDSVRREHDHRIERIEEDITAIREAVAPINNLMDRLENWQDTLRNWQMQSERHIGEMKAKQAGIDTRFNALAEISETHARTIGTLTLNFEGTKGQVMTMQTAHDRSDSYVRTELADIKRGIQKNTQFIEQMGGVWHFFSDTKLGQLLLFVLLGAVVGLPMTDIILTLIGGG